MTPTLSFLVPTHREDRPLARCLNSIAGQLLPTDEVIVIGDTHHGLLPGVQRLVELYDRSRVGTYRYLELDTGHSCWGHCQLDYGLQHARGQYVHCNDDDDIWTPHAANVMREAAAEAEGQPLLFRFVAYIGSIFWSERGRMERNMVGGHCLVSPNDGKLGKFACGYSGDFDMIESTVNAHGGPEQAVWREDIICVARP